MPIHVQHAIRATAPAGASDVFNPGASRPAPGPALWSRLRSRLAKTKAMAAMAIGLALASLAAALPAQAAPPTPSEIAVARGCAVGMVCVYASKAVFDDIKTTEPLSKITYSSSDSAFAYMKQPGGTAAGSVYAFPLSGMIGTNPARYIFNNTDKQISYITYLLLKPTKNIQRTYYYSSIDGSSSKTVYTTTGPIGACRVYKDNGQFVDPQDGQSLPLGSKTGYTITNALLTTLAQKTQKEAGFTASLDESRVITYTVVKDNNVHPVFNSYNSGKVDIDQFATSVNDYLDTIPGAKKITADEITAAQSSSISNAAAAAAAAVVGGVIDEAILNADINAGIAATKDAVNAAIKVILANNQGKAERATPMPGNIAFKEPAAGPSFAGILVSYESDGKIDGNGVRGDVGTGYTNLCNTLVNNKANKPASN